MIALEYASGTSHVHIPQFDKNVPSPVKSHLISIIYFKLAEITNGNEAEKLQIWAKYRQKVTKLSNQLQATNGLKNPLFLAR